MLFIIMELDTMQPLVFPFIIVLFSLQLSTILQKVKVSCQRNSSSSQYATKAERVNCTSFLQNDNLQAQKNPMDSKLYEDIFV